MRSLTDRFVTVSLPPREGWNAPWMLLELVGLIETASNSGWGVAGWPNALQESKILPNMNGRRVLKP